MERPHIATGSALRIADPRGSTPTSARLVLRALPPGSLDLDALSSKQSVAGKGTLT